MKRRKRWSGWRGSYIPCDAKQTVKVWCSGGSWRWTVKGLGAGLVMYLLAKVEDLPVLIGTICSGLKEEPRIWSHLIEPRDGGSVVDLSLYSLQSKGLLSEYILLTENAHLRLIPTRSNLYLLHPWTIGSSRLSLPVGCLTQPLESVSVSFKSKESWIGTITVLGEMLVKMYPFVLKRVFRHHQGNTCLHRCRPPRLPHLCNWTAAKRKVRPLFPPPLNES